MATVLAKKPRWIFQAKQRFHERYRVRGPGKLPAPLSRNAGEAGAPLVCRPLFDEICVLANGDIVCSCADPGAMRIYGNIHRDRLADVYDGAMYRELRGWQLASKPDRWCPATGCSCPLRVSRATVLDTVENRVPRMLQLEPISACNLRCPACPATEFESEPNYTADRKARLSLDEMISVFEQLPELEKVLLYNYGETFLHPEAMAMLRWLRAHRPGLQVHVSTNGIPLTKAKIEAIARERLIDRILFAIDGARPASYAKYRVDGRLDRALEPMRLLTQERAKHGGEAAFEILWQYILFEWNDSDEELAEARALAAQIGVPIEWVVTHTAGASQRYLPDSRALAELVGRSRTFRALSCDLKSADVTREQGGAGERYRATLRPALATLAGAPGERRVLPVTVRHDGNLPWGGDGSGPYRLGLKLLDRSGKVRGELRGADLPGAVEPGEELVLFLEIELPAAAGSYRLLLDLIEEGVCWFSERSSTPAICELEVGSNSATGWAPADLAAPARVALGALPAETEQLVAAWAEDGGALEDLLLELRRSAVLSAGAERALREQVASGLVVFSTSTPAGACEPAA